LLFLLRLILFFLELSASISEPCHSAGRHTEQLFDWPRDFRLLSLFLFRVPLLSLPFPRPLALSPPETMSLSFPFLSLSSVSFTMLIGTILRRHYLYQLMVAPLLKIPLILS
jgi:hypothetical protein